MQLETESKDSKLLAVRTESIIKQGWQYLYQAKLNRPDSQTNINKKRVTPNLILTLFIKSKKILNVLGINITNNHTLLKANQTFLRYNNSDIHT